MNINNDYQKRIGQITSFPTVEIIEPSRKYLESNSFYPLTNFFIGYYRWNDSEKLIELVTLHKKRPFNGAFYGFTKSSVSLFPLFQ